MISGTGAKLAGSGRGVISKKSFDEKHLNEANDGDDDALEWRPIRDPVEIPWARTEKNNERDE